MKTNVMAYYFPNFHPTRINEEIHGKGWTEWNVAKCALPKFEGHYQPKIPMWGYENENDPQVMKKKISFAKENGINGFIWDWYWFNEGPYRIDCLDDAFLKANEQGDFKLAVMWCNHDATYVHPGSYRDVRSSRMNTFLSAEGTKNPLFVKDGNITEETFVKATEHCIKNYFPKDYYYRIDGRLYFGFFRPDMLIKSFGSAENVKIRLDEFRNRVREAGLGELDIFGNAFCFPGNEIRDQFEIAKKMGFDTIGYYNGGFSGEGLEFPHCEYDASVDFMMNMYEKSYPIARELGLKYSITASTGWDVSPRTVQSDMYEDIGYPYCRIVNDSTPEKFQKCLKRTKERCEQYEAQTVTIFAFNEWTEGGYLEPDLKWKDGYAKAVKNVFASSSDSGLK